MLKRIRITPRMLFKFGWGKFWKTRQFYQDYPHFSEEAAHYLVDQKTELIALDTCSPDDSRIILQGNILGTEKDSPIHKILLGNGIVLVEYVANTNQLLDYENWSIVVMPLRIKGADGSPARVCIFREDENVIIKTSDFDQPSLTAKVPLAVVDFPQIKNAKPEGGSDLLVKKELSGSTKKKYRVEYDRPGCIGAGSCVAVQPERWVIRDENIENKADLLGGVEEKPGKWVLEFTEEEFEQFRSAATMCPVQVIKIFDIESGSQLTW